MNFDGKRTDRMRIPTQLSVDPEMGSEIRARAARRRREIGLEMVHLIEVGLHHDPEHPVHERRADLAEANSQERTFAHAAAPPRKAAHAENRATGTEGR